MNVPTAKACVPFGSENVIVVVLERLDKPSRMTNHELPDGSPPSVKVTRMSCLVVEITLTLSAKKFAV